MDYLRIYDDLVNNLKARYPNRDIQAHIGSSWHCYRYIQISTPIDDFFFRLTFGCLRKSNYLCNRKLYHYVTQNSISDENY